MARPQPSAFSSIFRQLDKVAIWAVLLFLPFAPMLTFLSRVLWIYLDQTMDPEK